MQGRPQVINNNNNNNNNNKDNNTGRVTGHLV